MDVRVVAPPVLVFGVQEVERISESLVSNFQELQMSVPWWRTASNMKNLYQSCINGDATGTHMVSLCLPLKPVLTSCCPFPVLLVVVIAAQLMDTLHRLHAAQHQLLCDACGALDACCLPLAALCLQRCARRLRVAAGHRVLSAAATCVPAGVVFASAEPSSWCPRVTMAVAGVMSQSLLPSPLHALVVHHPLRCVSLGTRSVGLLFLYGALESHLFFPLHAASGRCVLWAAAAWVPAGVVFVLAEPSSWRTGAVLLAAGVVSQRLLPTPLRILVVPHLHRPLL